MSIFKGLSAMFSKKQEIIEMSFDTYANSPLFQMVEKEAPFNDWKAPDTEVPLELENLFQICVGMYQMFAFYMLTVKRFGSEIAEKTLHIQIEKLSSVSEELGQHLESAIRQIHKKLVHDINEPRMVDVGEKKIRLPVEYLLAVEFLSLGEGAPFPVSREELEGGHLPDYKDADFALATCLEYGKNTALAYFEPLTRAKVTL